ncbi:MAG: acyl-[acyl-carrier-protein] thioesterase [Anaerolineales bacterium]
MTPIHSTTFPIRYYECDILGHLNNASYLKLMQEAAFEASKAVGYDRHVYAEMGKIWLIRETEIEYRFPVYYGQTVKVCTWVEDVRRIRSLRKYELYVEDHSDPAAVAQTDWVFVDRTTGNPSSVPPEVGQAYLGNDADVTPQPRRRFPPTPDPAPEIFSMQKRVEWRDLDPGGHVNNSVYLSYFDDCGMQVAAAYGWPWEKMKAENFAIVARKHHIEYLQSAVLDDELIIRTWVASMKRSTGVRYYEIYRERDQALIARSHSVYVWVDLERIRPIRVPEQILHSFRANIANFED